jgi:hypothetical protein
MREANTCSRETRTRRVAGVGSRTPTAEKLDALGLGATCAVQRSRGTSIAAHNASHTSRGGVPAIKASSAVRSESDVMTRSRTRLRP